MSDIPVPIDQKRFCPFGFGNSSPSRTVDIHCERGRCALWHADREACAHLVSAEEAEKQTTALETIAVALMRQRIYAEDPAGADEHRRIDR